VAWVVQLPRPLALGDTCLLCDAEPAVTTAGSASTTIEAGFLGRRITVATPCGGACTRRLRRLNAAAWSLFLLPWAPLLGFPLWEESVQRPGTVFVGLVVAMAAGYLLGAARWWTLRAVRATALTDTTVTLAFRRRAAAERIAARSGAEVRRVLWTG